MTIRYLIVPVSKIKHPNCGGAFQRYANAWWRYIPNEGVIFAQVGAWRNRKRITPQCNTDERIQRMLNRKYVIPDTRTDVLLIDSAWVPIDHEGSCRLPLDWVIRVVDIDVEGKP